MGGELAIAPQEGEKHPEEGERPGIARQESTLLAGGHLGEGSPADAHRHIDGAEDRPQRRQEEADDQEEMPAAGLGHGVRQAASRRPRIRPTISAAAWGILVPGP